MLEWTLYQNSVRVWLIAVGVGAVTGLALLGGRRLVLHNLRALTRRTGTTLDDAAIDVLTQTRYFFLVVVSLYAGSRVLYLPPAVQTGLRVVTVVVLTLQLAFWGNAVIGVLVTRRLQEKVQADGALVMTPRLLGFLARLGLWCVLLLVSLENLGVDVTALVAGLGIGGIAIALSVQTILGDIFASLSIMLDQPFVPGDFIIVGNDMGTVERVGVKTTRVRALSGEQLVFSNADLIGSRIRNFKRMYERRVVFKIGVVYQTSLNQLRLIPTIIRDIINSQSQTRFDRCHFLAYGAFSLDFEIVYYVLHTDYNVYMNIQQAINLEIFSRFGEYRIEFAYPTQTLLVQPATSAV
jgi:small-conductance mechanosensitive channel